MNPKDAFRFYVWTHEAYNDAAAPFAVFLGATTSFFEGSVGRWAMARTIIPPLLTLALAAAIYGLEEPGAGLNNRSLVLFLSYLGVFALVTYSYEGTQLLLSKRYGVPAAVRVFPIGVAVSLLAVSLTRVTGFQPGLMYGFIAAHTLASGAHLTEEQEGKQVLFPALALLAACLIAWVLAGPFRHLAEDHSGWWAAVPEGIAVGLFVTGLEGLFFQMIPIHFMDGHKLLRWNKPAWLAFSLISGFLFWEVLLNEDQQSISAVEQTKSIVALGVIAACLLATMTLWLFFKALGTRQPHEASAD